LSANLHCWPSTVRSPIEYGKLLSIFCAIKPKSCVPALCLLYISFFQSNSTILILLIFSKFLFNLGIKVLVNSLLKSIPSLIYVVIILLLFLFVFGILGVQLFSGSIGFCNDKNATIQTKNDCIG